MMKMKIPFDDKGNQFVLLNKYENYVETKSINLGLEEIEKIELSPDNKIYSNDFPIQR